MIGTLIATIIGGVAIGYSLRTLTHDDSIPKTDIPVGRKTKSERERIALANAQSTAIISVHRNANVMAHKVEDDVKNGYKDIYSRFFNVLPSNNANVSNLMRFIEEKENSFAHKMRNEINIKVCSQNVDWEKIISQTANSEEDVSRITEDANQYIDKVYVTAKKNLLDAFSLAVKETNEKIMFLISEERKEFQKERQTFVQLTKNKDSQNEELLRIAKENALMLFIKHESERKI